MKKNILFLTAIICCVLLTGCFKEKPMDTLTKTIDNYKNVSSLEVSALIHAKAIEEGVSATVDLPLTMAISETNEETVMKMSLGENAFIGEMDFFANVKKENILVYFPLKLIYILSGMTDYEEEDIWLKYEMSLEDVEMTDEDKENLEKLENLDYTKIIGEENFALVSEEENVNHYSLIINKDLLQRLATELGEDTTEFNEFDYEIKLSVYIDTTTHQFTKISADLKDIMSQIEIEEEIDLSSISELSFTLEFKNVNNTNITIDKEIVENATTLDELLGEE